MNQKLENLKILVTGASGYIGSELVTKLVASGSDVAIIKRSSSELKLLNNLLDKIKIFECDTSTESVINIVKDSNPDVVVHLASLFIAEHESADIQNLISSNLLFSTQIVEAMKQNDIKFLINTGTSWEHFNNSKYDPVCLYAATKHAFESILKFYVESNHLRVITLKLFDTYGPRDSRPKLVPLLQKLAQTGESLEMSEGQQLIDMVFIDDVIDAYLISIKRLLALGPKSNESYTVSSLNPVKLKNLVEIFEQASGTKLNINWGMRAYRSREVMTPWNTGCNIPGWQPKVGLFEGFCQIINSN